MVKRVEPNFYEVSKDEAFRYRKELRDKIQIEMKKASKEMERKNKNGTKPDDSVKKSSKEQ